jgi:hypothetical protein
MFDVNWIVLIGKIKELWCWNKDGNNQTFDQFRERVSAHPLFTLV